MKSKRKKETYIIISVLIMCILVLSIGFALLSSNLVVKFSSVSNLAETWDVAIITTGSITPTTEGTLTGVSCGNATATATKVELPSITLSKPGDKCTWHVQVKNNGTIDAIFGGANSESRAALGIDDANYSIFTEPKDASNNTITCTSPTDPGTTGLTQRNCGPIIYLLAQTESGGTRYKLNTTTIAAGETKELYIIAKYVNEPISGYNLTMPSPNEGGTAITGSSDATIWQKGAKFELLFSQK